MAAAARPARCSRSPGALTTLPACRTCESSVPRLLPAALEERLAAKTLPVWDGELYLEYHRGTYTSQAQQARTTASAEVPATTTPRCLGALASALSRHAYPARDARRGLGAAPAATSSTTFSPAPRSTRSTRTARATYARVGATGRRAQEGALQAITSARGQDDSRGERASSSSTPRRSSAPTWWSCTTPREYDRTVDAARSHPRLGCLYPGRWTSPGAAASACSSSRRASRCGYAATRWWPSQRSRCRRIQRRPRCLENRHYRIRLRRERADHIAVRQAARPRRLAPGQAGNVLPGLRGQAAGFDAWDIDIFYQDKMRRRRPTWSRLGSIADGPVVDVLRLAWSFAGSRIVQRDPALRSDIRRDRLRTPASTGTSTRRCSKWPSR